MALISALSGYPAPTSALTLRIGEESEPIVIMAQQGEPDLDDGFLLVSPSDRQVATTDLQKAPPKVSGPDNRKRAFTVTGRRAGSTRVSASWAGPKLVALGSLNMTVDDFKETDVDLFYVGKHLVWRRSLPPEGDADGLLIFAATSGKFTIASAQNMQNDGPLPAGRYQFRAEFDPLQTTAAQANKLVAEGNQEGRGPFKNTRQGIQRLPTGDQANVEWGDTRVRLEPQFRPPNGRGGFYLHDSHKGYSSGCIEVRRNESRLLFFDALISYVNSGRAQRKPTLVLQVIYRDQLTATQGATKE